MSKKSRRAKSPPFTQMMKWVTRSPAWRGLTPNARALYFELRERFNGHNNGMIGLGNREAEVAANMNKNTANRAFHELEAAGFIAPATKGAFRQNGRKATEWLLTELPDDRTGHMALKTFMPQDRKKASPSTGTVSPSTGTQTPKSKDAKPLRPSTGTETQKSPNLASLHRDTSRSTIPPVPADEAPTPHAPALVQPAETGATVNHGTQIEPPLGDGERALLRWLIGFDGSATHRKAQQNLSGQLKGDAIAVAALALVEHGLIRIGEKGRSRVYILLDAGRDPALLNDTNQLDLERWLSEAAQ